MNLRRVFILGLDGLEYDLVMRFDLGGIRQTEHGKIDLDMFEMIATAPIWASFLTGLSPTEHGVEQEVLEEWCNETLQRIRVWSFKFGLDKLGFTRVMDKFFAKLGFRKRWTLIHGRKDYAERHFQTIFNYAYHPIDIEVPTYSRNEAFLELYKAFYACTIGEIPEEDFERKVWDSFEAREKQCFKLLLEDWDLFMVHFHTLDFLGHFYTGNLTKMWEIYVRVNEFVASLKDRIGGDALFLIIADHGMKPLKEGSRYGIHSNYGFYSSNRELGLNYPKMTDFARLIIRELKR